jgi:hypothetical protein
MVIVLHLGAHKTATTYVQNALELSRDRLADAGVGYVPLAELRSGVTGRLGFGRRGLPGAADRILEDYRDCKRLILSDENIIGGLKPTRTGFYAKRGRRIAKLLNALGRREFEICFALRSYDEFLSAMYCEYIRHHPFVTAQSYFRRFDPRSFGWPGIVASFVAAAGASNVVIWRYEDFGLIENQVFEALTGAPADLVHKPADRVRESLSAKAVESLAGLSPTDDVREIRARARAAAAAEPKGPDNPTFSAFDPAMVDDLRERYERDVQRIRELYPEARFLALGSGMGS